MFKVPFLEKLSELKIHRIEAGFSKEKQEKTITIEEVECGESHTLVLVNETSSHNLGIFKT
jgi:hypothetical protein